MVRVGPYSIFELRRIVASIPQHAFESDPLLPAPDYDDLDNWSAHPLRPPGRAVEDANHIAVPGESLLGVGKRPCDCFFVHDSCFNPAETFPFLSLVTPLWNAPVCGLDDPRQAQLAAKLNEQVDWSVAADAACFNNICQVYAPRYRQAHVLSYAHFMRIPVFGRRLQDARCAFELAYSDVRRAFLAFLDTTAHTGRPFFLASHSQGTQHMVRLVQEELEGHPERLRRFIHGYLAGQAVPMDLFGRTLLQIVPSTSPTDCCSVSSWRTARRGHTVTTGRGIDTYDARVGFRRVHHSENILATNPITWTVGRPPDVGSEPSPVESYLGAAFPVPDNYDLKKHVGMASSGVSLRLGHVSAKGRQTLGVLIPTLTPIDCGPVSVSLSSNDLTVIPRFQDNCLFAVTEWDWLLYHDLDFPLFYRNIRKNAALRLSVWQMQSRL